MLEIRHIELSEANAYVTEYHRHHKAVQAHKCAGHRFSLACYADGRHGKRLFQAVWSLPPRGKGARVLPAHYLCFGTGEWRKLAGGFSYCYTNRGGSWNQPGRPRTDKAPACPKQLYEIML